MFEYTFVDPKNHVAVFRYNTTYHLEYYGELVCVGKTEYECLRYFEKKYRINLMETR